MAVAMALSEARTNSEGDGGPDDYQAEAVNDAIVAHAETLEPGRAAAFYGVASGLSTPLKLHMETWLAEGGTRGKLTEKTKSEHRKAVIDLAEWLTKERIGPTVEATSRKVAGQYVSTVLLPSGRHRRTVAKTVHTLSSYWKWLQQRGLADDAGRIPWEGQAPHSTTVDSTQDGAERAFTADELRLLLDAPPSGPLGDFMKVAALSGMRREEIGKLTVGDCAGGMFVVRKGKTDAARRRVPVHPDLTDIVTSRCEGKAATDFLFHELGVARDERSDPIGKLFTRYRRSMKIQDGEGRRSTVNFHSFRRFFATEAINAGQPPHVVSLVCGHSEGRRSITLSAYWRGSEDAALRACVEAVKLPPP